MNNGTNWTIACQTCKRGNYACDGYDTRLHWNLPTETSRRVPTSPVAVIELSPRTRKTSPSDVVVARQSRLRICYLSYCELLTKRTNKLRSPNFNFRESNNSLINNAWRTILSATLSSVLPVSSHFKHSHVSRVSYAIDLDFNGLRNIFLPMAAADPALLNGILAVLVSPLSNLTSSRSLPHTWAHGKNG